MSRIKGKNTKPEILVRKFLFNKGFRYRLHDKKLPGKPDLVLPKYRAVVMIHGCYWHGHEGCQYFVIPQTRTKWWLDKIEGNRSRDKRNALELKKAGWKVMTVWECELKIDIKEKTLTKLVSKLYKLGEQ